MSPLISGVERQADKQAMLSQSISVPQQSTNGYLPPSRSTSVSRASQPMTTPLGYEANQPFPSPAANGFDQVRPSRQRQLSYGFTREENMNPSSGAGPSSPSPNRWQGFDNDAFAAKQQQETDPWARMRQSTSTFGQQYTKPQESNPWAAFQMPSNGFAFQSQPQAQQQFQSPAQRFGQGRMPTPPDEDDEMGMDTDMMDEEEVEDEFDEPAQRASGFGQGGGGGGMEDKRAFSLTQLDHDQQAAALWQRGRRKT